MKHSLIFLALLGLGAAAHAQSTPTTTLKLGLTRYDTHSKTSGISGIGIPAGADAETSDATTVIFTGEYGFTDQLGVEFVLGVPPKIKARGTGTIAFLGDVIEARNVAPTVFVNYHFGGAGDAWRPYLGLGVNYTRFVDTKSNYGWDVHLSDSWGPAAHAGVDYAIDKRWGLFASVAVLKVKSDVTAVGANVIQATIDFRPVVYSAGVSYRF
jgi:outer membrane protein